MKKVALHFKRASKGQSFVELAIVASILLLLLVGMVEFGNLLNVYIGLVDAAREGARFGSNSDPFTPPQAGQCTFENCIDQIIEGSGTAADAGALSPILLDHNVDDVLVSYFSITNGSPATYVRWPGAGIAWSKWGRHTTQISDSFVTDRLDPNAPSNGILVVEIFYAYHQLLNLPIFTNVIPNPIQVHTYAIMPLSAAGPTPTP